MPAKYRAVIMGIREDSCDVLYVDFGNKSKVLFCDLYKIPHQFLLFKTFANSFRLSGLHKIPSSDHKSISEEFSNFTRDKSLFLRVVPLEGAPLSQYCELFNDRGVSVLDILMMHDPSLQHNAPKKVQPTHMSASLLRQLQAMPQHLQSSAHLQSSQTSTPVITRNDRDPRLVVNQRVLNFNQPPPLVNNKTYLQITSFKP